MPIYTPDLIVKEGLSPDTLWDAATKINENLLAISDGIEAGMDSRDYQNSVIDILSSSPSTPSDGARYIVGANPTGLWVGHADDIAEYEGSEWHFVTPNKGYCCNVEDENLEYLYTGTQWTSRPAATEHNSLTGKQGGTSDEYYHLTEDEVGYLPSSDQKDALAGTGTPSQSNLFATEDTLESYFDPDAGHTHDGENSHQVVWGDIDKETSDIADITTKSHTSLTDIGTTTHANIDLQLPTADEKAALAGTGTPSDDNVFVTEDDSRLTDTRDPKTHHSSHISGATDEVDGDKIDIDWDGSNYTPSIVTEADSVEHLTAHLKGIDNALGGKSASNHTHGNLPTDGQKAALAGTGTPAASNVFVTKDTLISAVFGLGEYKDSVIDKDIATPPGSPSLYDSYIVAANPTGAWAGHTNNIAKWNGQSWEFVVPVEGVNSVYVADEDWIYLFNGTAWFAVNAPVPGPQGYQGYQGYQGQASSVPGPQGYQGYQGQASSVPGPQGYQGYQGQASSVPGPQGYQGGLITHASTHISGAADEIDGDKIDIDLTLTNIVPIVTGGITTATSQLSSILKGVDTFVGLASVSSSPGAIPIADSEGSVDAFVPDTVIEIDVDQLESGYTPLNYAPVAAEGSVSDTTRFISHLNGLDKSIGPDVVGGRLDLSSATQLIWNFQTSNHIRLFNPTTSQWEIVRVTTAPTAANTATDLASAALVPNTIYDVFAEYSSATAFNLVFSRWSYGGDGANNSGTGYATPVMTSNSAPGPVTLTSYSEYSSFFKAYHAFDQTNADGNDVYISSAAPSVGTPQWLKVDFGQGNSVCINKYAIQETNAAGQDSFFPRDFSLLGSNDDSTYITLDTRSSVSGPGQNLWTSYFYTTPSLSKQPYRYYKLSITANNGGANHVDIGQLKLIADSKSLAGTSARIAAYESTVLYAIGDRVSNGGHAWVKISTAAAGTTPVAGSDWCDNGTTITGDFAGLYQQDGIWVSSSSNTGKTRRWLGIIYTYNNSGTVNFKDDVNNRYISNYYNKKQQSVYAYNTNDTWTYAVAAWQESNNGNGAVRANFITCDSRYVNATRTGWVMGATSSAYTLSAGIVLNHIGSPTSSEAQAYATASNNVHANITCAATLSVPIGYNYVAEVEDAINGQQLTIFSGQYKSGTRILLGV